MSETSAPERSVPTVEFVPFPDGPEPGPAPLGPTVLDDDPPPPTPWVVPAVILLVLGVSVIVAVAALASGGSERSARPVRAGRDAPPSTLDRPLGLDPTTTGAPATTSAQATTIPSTTGTPSSTTGTPATTTAAVPVPGSTPLADGWIRYVAADPSFAVDLPAEPEVSRELVRIDGADVTRTERIVELPGGTLGIGSVARDPGADPDAFLMGVAADAAAQLGGRLELGAGGEGAGGRVREFAVVLDTGRLEGLAVSAGGTLHLVTVSGDTASLRPVYDRVRTSFTAG